jgi:glyoxylase I family protein
MTRFSVPRRLNHVAYVTRDTAATIRFYEDILGMPLVSYAAADKVPSTGDSGHFLHTFFQMGDGSCIAFFEIEGLPAEALESRLPLWARHLALSVDSPEELEDARQHLLSHGVDVLGPVDHEGIWSSLYFFDPNGVRLEITYQGRSLEEQNLNVHEDVARWLAEHG